jgi:hypothetical protein
LISTPFRDGLGVRVAGIERSVAEDAERGSMAVSAYQPGKERTGSALCLSGGGFRAALFHLGARRCLNEIGLLSKMTTVSSVSGGSVTNDLLAKVWPQLTSGPGSCGRSKDAR